MRSMKHMLTFIMVLLLAVAPAAIAGSGDLAISDFEWRIDGDKDTSTSAEAKPGDTVKLKIEVSNEQADSQGEIENIDIEITVDELNDDVGELEFDDSEDKIREGSDKTFTFNWDVPLRVDEGTFDVVIKVEGENETNNVDFTDELTLELEVDKRSHELAFDRAEFLSEQLSCAATAELRYRLYNIGTNDEDITFTVKNTQLGVDYEDQFTLDEGDNDDSYRQQTIQLDLPEDKTPGNYVFTITADYGSNSESEQVTLQIGECETDVEEEEPEVVVVTTPTQPTVTPTTAPVVPTSGSQAAAAPITVKSSSNSNTLFVVALVAGYLIVIAVIIALLVALRRKK